MNNLLEDLIYKDCLVYLDDIIIFFTSLEEHILSLKKEFQKLRDANFKLQLDKCEFMKSKNYRYKTESKKNKCHRKFPDTKNRKRNKIISRIMWILSEIHTKLCKYCKTNDNKIKERFHN